MYFSKTLCGPVYNGGYCYIKLASMYRLIFLFVEGGILISSIKLAQLFSKLTIFIVAMSKAFYALRMAL